MKVLIIVNVDWFFLSHRLPIAIQAIKEGHEVHVATAITRDPMLIKGHGINLHPLKIERKTSSVISNIKLLFNITALMWKIKPDIVHLVTIKPVIIGGIGSRLSPVKGVVFAISGLGHTFVDDSIFSKIRLFPIKLLYKISLSKKNKLIIFQNSSDKKVLSSIKDFKEKETLLLNGSGVNLRDYPLKPFPPGKPVVFMASRLLETKGVKDFVKAAEILTREGVEARYLIAGAPDPENPASIKEDELEEWRKGGTVEILGHRNDISELMQSSHVVVLPSYYGEGLPKVLIEASACGRATITTDLPGCRDAIEPHVTGLLVPPRNPKMLAEAIKKLVTDLESCERMGLAGRKRAENLFDITGIVKEHMNAYDELFENYNTYDKKK